MPRDFWPCVDVYGDDGVLSSVIFTQFQRLDRTYPKFATTGYAVERLVKKLASPELRKRVGFDPEADMFAAYGDDPDALFEVAMLLKTATGQSKPPRHTPQLAPDAARAALRRGFVEALDPKAQKTFLQGWPRPRDAEHEELEKELKSRDATKRLGAARQLHRAACRVVGNIHNPLTHPTSFDTVVAALDKERDVKVADELVGALSMMCERALPDQRMQPVLERFLSSPRWGVRWSAVEGLSALYQYDWSKLAPLFDDPKDEVRAAVCKVAWRDAVTWWAIGKPELLHAPVPEAIVRKLEAKLADKACQQFASTALKRIRARSRPARTPGS